MSRPNILVVITDQQTAAAMSCTGNPWLSTPAMDRLAARGVRFERAYCSYPLCSPARMSQMTGRYPHQMGVNSNEGKSFWGYDVPTSAYLPGQLAAAGYRCVWAGKDMPPADGSRDIELLCRWGDVQTADHTCAFLAGEHDRPFFAAVNFVNPHNICEWARGAPLFEGGIGEEPVLADLPLLPANHAVPPYEPELLRVIQAMGGQNYACVRNFTPEDWRRYRWAYFRMVEKVDRQIARVLDALDEAGLTDDTLVWFCSDHGDGCGAHAWNQKQTLYEEVIQVPTILAGPGVEAGRTDARLVASSLDLMPTCLDAAGVAIDPAIEGRSLLPLARGERVDDWREAVYVETALKAENSTMPPAKSRGRAVITERWKYSAWAWGRHREQLVDLATDPGEMVNLATSSRYAERRDAMRAQLNEWTRRTEDAFMVPGHEILSPHALCERGR